MVNDEPNKKIIAILSNAKGFIAGEDLAKELGISRVALWKRIQGLKTRGCRILSSHEGYKLVEEDTVFKQSDHISWTLETESTMDLALHHALRGQSKGAFVADKQHQGRDRRGQNFENLEGGLFASWILKPEWGAAWMGSLAIRFLHLVCDNFSKLYNTQLSYVWPGDILFEGKKIGGLLIEILGSLHRPRCVILGLGIYSSQIPGLQSSFKRRDLIESLSTSLELFRESPPKIPMPEYDALVNEQIKTEEGQLFNIEGYDSFGNLKHETGILAFGQSHQFTLQSEAQKEKI